MVRVQALTKHPYDGIERSPGELYEMNDSDVDIMLQIGNVRTVSPFQGRDLQPTEPKKYRRRDMKVGE